MNRILTATLFVVIGLLNASSAYADPKFCVAKSKSASKEVLYSANGRCPKGTAALPESSLPKGETGASGQNATINTTLISYENILSGLLTSSTAQKLGNIGTFTKLLGATESRIDLEVLGTLTTVDTVPSAGSTPYCAVHARIQDQKGVQFPFGIQVENQPGEAIQYGEGTYNYISKGHFLNLPAGSYFISLWAWGRSGTTCINNQNSFERLITVNEVSGSLTTNIYP